MYMLVRLSPSLSLFISVCRFVSLSVSLSLSLSGLLVDPSLTFQPTYLPALSTRLSIRPSRSSFVHLSLHLSKESLVRILPSLPLSFLPFVPYPILVPPWLKRWLLNINGIEVLLMDVLHSISANGKMLNPVD